MMGRLKLRILLPLLAAAALASPSRADDKASMTIDQQVAEATRSSAVTIVHFWAPWCPNCRDELSNGGWSSFIAANPGVNFVFVTIWNPADGRAVLEKNGVGAEPNFRLLLHPNGSRTRGKMVDQVMGIPISWIPTTWIFRDGHLCYAMNFGELRFPMLQQLIADSQDSWDR
jgi:thiol-disulfide isomerase/thioredoxin